MILCCVPHPSFNGFAYYVIRYILLYFRHKGAAVAAFEDLCTIRADLLLGDFFRRSSVCAPLSEHARPAKSKMRAATFLAVSAPYVFPPYKFTTNIPSTTTDVNQANTLCHGKMPQAYRTVLPYMPKACDKCHRLLCWRYLSFRAVSSQVLSAEASLTSVFGMGTGGPSP